MPLLARYAARHDNVLPAGIIGCAGGADIQDVVLAAAKPERQHAIAKVPQVRRVESSGGQRNCEADGYEIDPYVEKCDADKLLEPKNLNRDTDFEAGEDIKSNFYPQSFIEGLLTHTAEGSGGKIRCETGQQIEFAGPDPSIGTLSASETQKKTGPAFKASGTIGVEVVEVKILPDEQGCFEADLYLNKICERCIEKGIDEITKPYPTQYPYLRFVHPGRCSPEACAGTRLTPRPDVDIADRAGIWIHAYEIVKVESIDDVVWVAGDTKTLQPGRIEGHLKVCARFERDGDERPDHAGLVRQLTHGARSFAYRRPQDQLG